MREPDRRRARAGARPAGPSSSARSSAGSLYVGSPETVARKIAATVRALGASRFDLKYSAGTLAHERLLRSIELYGREVIPRVRRAAGAEAAPADKASGGRRGRSVQMVPLSVLDLAPIVEGGDAAPGVPPLARPRAARGALGLPPLLARRAPRHAGHRQRGDGGRHRPRRRRHVDHPRRRRRHHAAEPRAARDRRAVRHARVALSRGGSTSASAARPGSDQLTARALRRSPLGAPSTFPRTSSS